MDISAYVRFIYFTRYRLFLRVFEQKHATVAVTDPALLHGHWASHQRGHKLWFLIINTCCTVRQWRRYGIIGAQPPTCFHGHYYTYYNDAATTEMVVVRCPRNAPKSRDFKVRFRKLSRTMPKPPFWVRGYRFPAKTSPLTSHSEIRGFASGKKHIEHPTLKRCSGGDSSPAIPLDPPLTLWCLQVNGR